MNMSVLTYAAAARRLGVHRSRVSQLVRSGRLATLTLDGRMYVSVPSLSAYQANRARRVPGQLKLLSRVSK